MYTSVIIKLILSILFLICLFQLPYGYYEFVRFAALVGFAWLGYRAYQKGNFKAAFVYGALALLFQPLLKIALGRTLWNIVDVLVAVGLLASLFLGAQDKKQKTLHDNKWP